jgi:mannose-6-phosphate isomerase-like protein (cupin superfamily)
MIVRALPFFLCTMLLACAPAGNWIGADIAPRHLDALLAQNRIAPGENIKVVRVLRNDHVEHLLVQVRDREPLHYHADSDITVVIRHGNGTIRIADRETPVHAGDIVHIPRGTVHAYINKGPDAGVAFVIMAPPPGPADRVVVEVNHP